MQDLLKGLDPNIAGYAGVGVIAVLALVVFRVARRIVMLGYFLLYFFIGFAVVFAASAYSTRSLQVPLFMPITGGLAFAVVANMIRAKLMRIVGMVMLIALASLIGKFWTQYTEASRPGGDKSVTAENARLAQEGLKTAKSEFTDLLKYLPKKDGKIAGGYISQDTLQKAGLEGDFKKVNQKPAWHTWLTGLYEQESEDLGIWTAGGTPEQAKKSLKLKERTTSK
jgi:hypothetical protein